MLDVEGSVETAGQGRDTAHAQERKVDLVVRELDRYAIKIAALQETKWQEEGVVLAVCFLECAFNAGC